MTLAVTLSCFNLTFQFLTLSFTPTTLSVVLSIVPVDDYLRFFEISVVVVAVVVVVLVN